MLEMKLSRILSAIPLLLALSACDDSSSTSTTPPAVDLQGTWLHHESSELRDLLRFQGDRVHHESYRLRCQLSQTEGTWTLQGNILRVTPDTVWSRGYEPDSRDSASFCASEPRPVTVTGSLRMELANVGASSFDVKSHKFTVTETGMTDSVIVEHYVRQ
jgi:hypothetical protein